MNLYISICLTLISVISYNQEMKLYSFLNHQDTIVKAKDIKQQIDLVDSLYSINTSQAIIIAKENLRQSLQHFNDTLICESLYKLGDIHSKLGDNKNSLEYYKKAINYANKINDPHLEAKINRKIGNLFWYAGDYNLAIQYYKKNLLHSMNYGSALDQTIANISVGLTMKNLEKYDSSLIYINKAIQISELNHMYEWLAISLLNKANVYLEDGHYEYAEILLSEIETNYLNFLSKENLPQFYNTAPEIFIRQKKYDKARQYLNKSFTAAKESNYLFDLQKYYQLRFQLENELNNKDSALHYLKKYYTLKDSIASNELKSQLANYQILYEIEVKQNEIEQLKHINKIQALKLNQNKFIIYASILIIILLIISVFQFFRILKVKSHTNKRLNDQNEELQSQKEEISATLEKLKQTQDQLIQSEKMASLATLMSGFAHEINNPLNFINGGKTIIEELCINTNYTKEVTDSIHMISEGINRISLIMRTMEKLLPKQGNEKKMVDINQTIEDTLLFLLPGNDENIEFIKKYNLNTPVFTIENQVQHALLNLLDNAIYFSQQTDGNNPIVKIYTKSKKINTNKYAEISIYNTFKIKPGANPTKFFNPFYTTKAPGEGSGLGLTIAYNYIKELGGNISVQHSENGIEFKITLPTD